MTEERPRLTRRELVRIWGATTVRLIIGVALILGCLSLVPESPGVSVLVPITGIALVVILYVWLSRRQIERVRSARYPSAQAVEALVLIAVMFLAVFAGIYVMISTADQGAFTEPLDHFTAFYFALTVLATVGFGDITPVTDGARLVCMVQMGIDIVFIGVLVKILGGAASQGLRARKATSQAEV